MSWLLALMIIALLVGFNIYSAESLNRMRRDVTEIHRAIIRSRPEATEGAGHETDDKPLAS